MTVPLISFKESAEQGVGVLVGRVSAPEMREPDDQCRQARTRRQSQQQWFTKMHIRMSGAGIMPEMSRNGWQGRALVVGGGGIGRALRMELAQRHPSLHVTLATRNPLSEQEWKLDLESPASFAELTERLTADQQPLRMVFNATGRLHSASLQPEKRLQHVEQSGLIESFAINAAGPLLLAKSVESVLTRDRPFHFASLSARVGSIADNRSGGWYAYRAAKAAQNMMLHSLSLEWGRRLPLATVTLLHPGTTDTALSKPFQSFVPPEKLFSPERAAGHLLDVLLEQTPSDSGKFLAWDGQEIPW